MDDWAVGGHSDNFSAAISIRSCYDCPNGAVIVSRNGGAVLDSILNEFLDVFVALKCEATAGPCAAACDDLNRALACAETIHTWQFKLAGQRGQVGPAGLLEFRLSAKDSFQAAQGAVGIINRVCLAPPRAGLFGNQVQHFA